MSRRTRGGILGLPISLLALVACGTEPAGDRDSAPSTSGEGRSRRGRPEMVEMLRADLEAVRHPADGGGRAWLDREASDLRPVAGTAGRFTIVYEAGPLGIAAGGALFLQVSPFWGWSTPQATDAAALGFTTVETAAAGVVLTPRTLDQQLLAVEVGGRALGAGERVRIAYGAGALGAVVDRFAERASRFWIAVDGDGDGVRRVLADSPSVEVRAGPPAKLIASLPATARPGETVRLTLALVDGFGNAGPEADGVVQLELPSGLEGSTEVVLTAQTGARTTVELEATEEGVYRVEASLRIAGDSEPFAAVAGPLQVAAGAPRILWGDLQVHTAVSDGSGEPADVLAYARDVAGLDVVALTDHDHWGMRFLDASPDVWQATLDAVAGFDVPGRFVVIPGFEWTSWVVGHRHVLFFDPASARVLSTLDPAFDTPAELWDALRGEKALTITHHTAGGPIATDWSIPPDPELEPLTEVASVHGASEAPDAPTPIYRPVAGNWARDALARGYRLGFIGSSDGHDGHPGLGQLASPSSGLAAILAEEATREAVYEALRSRRAYATNGARIVLRVAYGGYRMGSAVPLLQTATGWEERPPAEPLAAIPPHTLVVQALGSGPLERIDVVHPGGIESTACDGDLACGVTGALGGRLSPGDWLYVRVVEEDGGAAWSSPFFFEEGSP